MPEFALIVESTGVILRKQSFSGDPPELSEKKDLAWLPIEEAREAPGEGEVALPATEAVVDGKVVITQGKRERTALETYAAISDRKLIEAIVDHVAGTSSKSFEEYVALKTAAIEVNPHDGEPGEVVIP